MTASMIVWTLELLDWIKEQLYEQWPEVKLRGSAPDIGLGPYRIRCREGGEQYWLVLSPDTIRNTEVSQVVSLLETAEWIPTMQNTGGVVVEVREPSGTKPFLMPWPVLGPEVRVEASA